MGAQEAAIFLEEQGLMPTLLGPVELRIGIPAFTYASEGCALALERAASSRPGRITIHPKYSNMDTASAWRYWPTSAYTSNKCGRSQTLIGFTPRPRNTSGQTTLRTILTN